MFLRHKLQLKIIVEWGWDYSLSRQAFTLEWQVISYTISWCDAHELLTLIQANSTRRDIDRNVFNRLAENDDKKDPTILFIRVQMHHAQNSSYIYRTVAI